MRLQDNISCSFFDNPSSFKNKSLISLLNMLLSFYVQRLNGLKLLHDEITYKLLKLVKDDPQLSQREIAARMGISLGKANYCVKSLIKKGHLKAKNFYGNNNKKAYMYILTPRGIEEKARLTYSYLKIKVFEYEEIKKEIHNLKLETAQFEEQGK